jgi:hypothetical protein
MNTTVAPKHQFSDFKYGIAAAFMSLHASHTKR